MLPQLRIYQRITGPFHFSGYFASTALEDRGLAVTRLQLFRGGFEYEATMSQEFTSSYLIQVGRSYPGINISFFLYFL